MDPKSNIVYFANGHSVWQLAGGSSKATLLAGDIHVAGYVDGKGTNAKFNMVCGIAFDTNRQRLIVADTGNNVIRTVSLDGTVSSLAGCASTTGDYMDGVATEAKFRSPSGLLCDPINVGDLFVADGSNQCVRLITSDAKEIFELVRSSTRLPQDLWRLCAGYACRDVVKTATEIPREIGYEGQSRVPKFTPSRMAFDTLSGDIYISESHAIRRWKNGELSLYAGSAGRHSVGRINGTFLNARFHDASGIAIDSHRRILYVVDPDNHCIRAVDLPPLPLTSSSS